jgi:hypothetical protein
VNAGLHEIWENMRIAFASGGPYYRGVVPAINRVFTVLQKAIREQLLSYYSGAFCMVHSRQDGKAVL